MEQNAKIVINFCARCGKPLNEKELKQEKQEKIKSIKKPKYGLVIGIVCFVVVAVIAIAVIDLSLGKATTDVASNDNEDTDENEAAEIDNVSTEADATNTCLERIHISKISATSELNAQSKDGSTNIPENMVDVDINTAWLDGTDGVGIGESISIEFDEEKDVSEIDIYPRFLKTKYRYLINGQPTKMSIEWENGQEEIRTKFLKFTIIDAVSGTKYSDTAISEIMVYEKK